MERKVGDRIRDESGVHGPLVGIIVKVSRWRLKTYYHVEWACGLVSRELAGRDDSNWIVIE